MASVMLESYGWSAIESWPSVLVDSTAEIKSEVRMVEDHVMDERDAMKREPSDLVE